MARYAIIATNRYGNRKVLRNKLKKPIAFTKLQAEKELKLGLKIPVSRRAKNPRIIKITPSITKKVLENKI